MLASKRPSARERSPSTLGITVRKNGKLTPMTPPLNVPPPRSREIRALSRLRLSRRMPGPVHFALAGGGAHGCVQWGLLQALSETDITPDALIGTSAGALTGAIFAEDPVAAVHRLAYVWSQLDMQSMVGDNWLGIVRSATRRRSALAENAAMTSALRTILRARTFDDLDVPFAAVTTDLATGLAVAHDSGELIPALLASSAIPGMLPPVTINGRRYVDGLASANLPASLAVQRGAGCVVVLDTGSRAPTELSISATKVVGRVDAILGSAQRRAQLSAAARHVPVILLPTPTHLGGALDFRGTIETAAESYEMARGFLEDLAARNPRQHLKAGLYARPTSMVADPDILSVLKPVR